MIKVLTAEEMREADRLTIEAGIPGLILMENAACRVVDFLVERYSPLDSHRFVIVCGKGNNGGDGLAIARQILTRFRTRSLQVFLVADANELSGDARANYDMFVAAGGVVADGAQPPDAAATLVIDALLGTGLRGPAAGRALEWIRRMNTGFPDARIVAVDIPSGLVDGGQSVRAHHTVTFAAPKLPMVQPVLCEAVGELIVARIGISDAILDRSNIAISALRDFDVLLAPRGSSTHKGSFGHVLVVGGAPGKSGAAAMSGLAALRAGAGLVTVASSDATGFPPELMSARLEIPLPLDRKTVLAIGPGLGTEPQMIKLVRATLRETEIPTVIDADGLNAIAGLDAEPWPADSAPRILTPHPGEMGRLTNMTGDRIVDAAALAKRWNCCVVLKGARTVIAFEDGEVFVNPTGSPALAKAGSGDILTGVIAGLVAQFPAQWKLAVRCAVFLHGRAGELAARALGSDKAVIATDLLRYLYADL
jgi:ADP-dependent NAD(P)H-hydrate dehydratase / NAD(P)H-hydrate epimerase